MSSSYLSNILGKIVAMLMALILNSLMNKLATMELIEKSMAAQCTCLNKYPERGNMCFEAVLFQKCSGVAWTWKLCCVVLCLVPTFV